MQNHHCICLLILCCITVQMMDLFWFYCHICDWEILKASIFYFHLFFTVASFEWTGKCWLLYFWINLQRNVFFVHFLSCFVHWMEYGNVFHCHSLIGNVWWFVFIGVLRCNSVNRSLEPWGWNILPVANALFKSSECLYIVTISAQCWKMVFLSNKLGEILKDKLNNS